MKLKTVNLFLAVILTAFLCVLMGEPSLCQHGTAKGIALCGQVIIPSLFPFTACVLFIFNADICGNSVKLKSLTSFLTGFPPQLFVIFVFSLIGGYPIGAGLLNSAVISNKTNSETAEKMLPLCVNAGPAFIISVIGNGILKSRNVGIILLISHLLATFSILCIYRLKNVNFTSFAPKNTKQFSVADNFVFSVTRASETVIKICGFVILFSVINEYLNFLGDKFPFLNSAILLLEITNAVTLTKNVYLISFLLGFGGISIWLQVIFSAKNLKINLFKFALIRILHGIISAVFTYLSLQIFPQYVPTLSNGNFKAFEMFYSTASTGISLLILGIVLIISISKKKVDKCNNYML